MKVILSTVSLVFLVSCFNEHTGDEFEATHWGLEIKSRVIDEEVPETPIKGEIRVLVDGEERVERIDEFPLPTSGVVTFFAEEVVEVSVDPVDYPHPVYFQLIRYDNLHLIEWPEEADRLESTRFFYERVGDLHEKVVVNGPFAPKETWKTFAVEDIDYSEDDYLSVEQIHTVLLEIEPDLRVSRSDGRKSTNDEEYDVDWVNYKYTEGAVTVEITVTARDGSRRLDSLELEIVYPKGEFDSYSTRVERLSDKFIKGTLSAISNNSQLEKWCYQEIFKHLSDPHDGRAAFVGNYRIQTYRVTWEYVEPTEKVGLEIERNS